ncbi:Proline iminopeptidase [Triticum urartu]|uniref:prolyl aminopeptidase n=1 Tax=Triticum urartu TaxID=4572 RepID=M8ACR4_TRIUA|nr:Proline iminopeptidase [Triticum urartu]
MWFFDPEFYRIVLFDQRGAGKSTPHACLEENTTWDLVADIEKLRQHLDIPEWQAIAITSSSQEFVCLYGYHSVFGGSWGSTLALAYSQTHPDKVTGIVLRGIFLLRKKELEALLILSLMVTGIVLRGIFLLRKKELEALLILSLMVYRKKELDWFYEGGAAAVFPDAWEPFRDFIPEDERNCFIAAYSKRLTSSDADVQAFARIENHYFINKGFLDSDSHLLDNVDKIRHIKTFIVQGRYDMCCPMMSAWDLHKAWPEAEFKVVPDAGHSANEVGVAAELVSANEKLKSMLKK